MKLPGSKNSGTDLPRKTPDGADEVQQMTSFANSFPHLIVRWRSKSAPELSINGSCFSAKTAKIFLTRCNQWPTGANL
jgi:hypothetical protein